MMSVYKACDIRGDAAGELTPELFRKWGRGLGLQVAAGEKFVVGGDMRKSTPTFLVPLIEGLSESGTDAVDLGILPTPMVYHAKRRLAASGCAIVTGSHNPAAINGLKWMIGRCPPSQRDVEALEQRCADCSLVSHGRQARTPRTLDISFDYVAWLQERWVDARQAKCHVVLDPMHGCNASRARRYLQAIFPHSLFSAIHDNADPSFGGRAPDCSRVEHLEELCTAVDCQRAHLGVAFDGDGDRVAFVDNHGVPLTPEEATWIFLRSLGSELAGQKFVYDLKFSNAVPEAARQLGAETLVEPSGHAFVRRRMIQTGALFGAEVSGHYFFRELDGGDDAIFAACCLIDILARSGKTLAELRRECPAVYMTPELHLPVDPQDALLALEQVRASWLAYPQCRIDGIRVDLPDGWVLVRNSATESALTFRFESSDWHRLHRLVWRFCDALPSLGDELWARYEETMVARCPLP